FLTRQIDIVERYRDGALVVFKQQGLEKAAQGRLSRPLGAVDPDDQGPALVAFGDVLAERAPVLVDDVAVVLGQPFFGNQPRNRGAHATLSGSGSPLAKASTFASAFIPIAMRVSESALPRWGSRTTFSSSSSVS